MAIERRLDDGTRVELVPVLRWLVRGGVPVLQQGLLSRPGGRVSILEWADVETVADESPTPAELPRDHLDGTP